MTEYKVSGWLIIGPDGEPICQVDYALHSTYDAETNALLIADAFNVAKRTGKIPSQLVKERDESVDWCKALIEYIDAIPDDIEFEKTMPGINRDMLEEFIAKAEGK